MKKRISAVLLAASCVFSAVSLTAAETNSPVSYTVSSETVAAGEQFDITVGFNGLENAVCYVVHLDDESLASSGAVFVDVKEIGENKAAVFAPDPTDANDVGAAYPSAVVLDGEYVKYTFQVPEGTAIGSVISFTFKSLAYNESNKEITQSKETAVSVTVGENAGSAEKPGDVNLNGSVDIGDAILIFMHSMLPNSYPISYTGSIDFNKDNSVDIGDAILLFMHSMLPDNYPI